MEKSKITKIFGVSNTRRDYTYGIMFLLISAFFLFFVVRPVLSIALSLNRERQDLVVVEKQLHSNFLKSIALKNSLEKVRDDLGVLDKALPARPQLESTFRLIQKIGNDSNIAVKNIDVEKVTYVKDVPTASDESYLIRAQFVTNIENLKQFIAEMYNYQKILIIKKMRLSKSTKAQEVNVNLVIESPTYW